MVLGRGMKRDGLRKELTRIMRRVKVVRLLSGITPEESLQGVLGLLPSLERLHLAISEASLNSLVRILAEHCRRLTVLKLNTVTHFRNIPCIHSLTTGIAPLPLHTLELACGLDEVMVMARGHALGWAALDAPLEVQSELEPSCQFQCYKQLENVAITFQPDGPSLPNPLLFAHALNGVFGVHCNVVIQIEHGQGSATAAYEKKWVSHVTADRVLLKQLSYGSYPRPGWRKQTVGETGPVPALQEDPAQHEMVENEQDDLDGSMVKILTDEDLEQARAQSDANGMDLQTNV